MTIFLTARRKVRGKGSVSVTSEFSWSSGSWCHVDSGGSAVYVPWLRLAVKGKAQMLVALRCDSCVTSLTRFFLSHRPQVMGFGDSIVPDVVYTVREEAGP